MYKGIIAYNSTMRTILPFEPPNEHACLALYHPQKNTWWLVMGPYNYDDMTPWTKAIRSSGGTLAGHHIAASHVRWPSSWYTLRNSMRAHKDNGFVVAVGALGELSPSGTRWLRSEPTLWWDMHSASVDQLAVIQSCPQRSELVLGALSRQGYLGSKKSTPARNGPSFVEHRWRVAFPQELAFRDHCQALGLGSQDALGLWKSSQMKDDMVVGSQEFGNILNGFDLR